MLGIRISSNTISGGGLRICSKANTPSSASLGVCPTIELNREGLYDLLQNRQQ